MKIYTLIFLIIFLYKVGSAQSVWDLTKCINYSLENNISLKNGEIAREIQLVNYSQSRLNQLPSISGNINASENFGRTVDPATNTYSDINYFNNSYGLNASMVLFSGFVQLNRIAFERYNLIIETNKLAQQKNKIVFSVIDAYFRLQLNIGVYGVCKENLVLMQEQLNSLKRFINLGRKAESDTYEFEAKLATDSFLLVQQAGNVEKAELALKIAMNCPVKEIFMIDSLPPAIQSIPDTIKVSSLTVSAKKLMPELQITENRLQAAKRNISQIHGGFFPSIEIYAGWNTSYYKTSGMEAPIFRDQFKNHAGEYVGVSMNIPIFNRFSRISTLHIAKLNYDLSYNAHLETTIALEREVNEAYIDWKTSQNEYLAAQKQLMKTNIAYQTAEKKMKIGQLNIIEFYIQKNELLSAKTELLKTNIQLAFKQKYINFLMNGNWFDN